MSWAHTLLWEYLHAYCPGRHRGQNHARLTRDLQAKAPQLQLNERAVRRLVHDLVSDHNKPIGATPHHGVFVIQDEEDYQAALHDLTVHALPILRRRSALKRAWSAIRQPDIQEVLPL